MTDNTSNLRELVFDLALRGALSTQLHSQEAVPFLRSIVREYYDVDADGQIRPNDKTPLGFDNQPLPIEKIGEHLKFKHSYLFQPESAPPPSQTAAPKPIQKSRAEMSLAEKAQFIHVYGESAYFALPQDATAAIPLSEKRRSQMTVAEKAALIREKGSEYYESIPE